MTVKQSYDRYEFCNVVIGWLGDLPLYERILGCTLDDVNRLISDPSENFEVQIANKMAEMTVAEMNDLAMEFNLACMIHSVHEPLGTYVVIVIHDQELIFHGKRENVYMKFMDRESAFRYEFDKLENYKNAVAYQESLHPDFGVATFFHRLKLSEGM